MLSPSLEDYLEEIYRLSFLKEKIRLGEVAARLGVTSPSAVKALKRLNEAGYLVYIKYAEIRLTEKGTKLGELLVRRNTTLQDFLKIIGSCCDVTAEAEAMEHYLCSSTLLALERLISFLKIKEIGAAYERFCSGSNIDDWSKDIETAAKE